MGVATFLPSSTSLSQVRLTGYVSGSGCREMSGPKITSCSPSQTLPGDNLPAKEAFALSQI